MLEENKNQSLFDRLKKLKLPVGKYAVFGSGPLGIRNLRVCRDLDIIVTEDLFDKYKEKIGWVLKNHNNSQLVVNNDIELWKDWGPGNWDINKLIQEAEMIDGLSFTKLTEVLKWKESRRRKKDLKDVAIIKKFNSTKL